MATKKSSDAQPAARKTKPAAALADKAPARKKAKAVDQGTAGRTGRDALLEQQEVIELEKLRTAVRKLNPRQLRALGNYGEVLAEEREELDAKKNWDFTQVTNKEWRPIRMLMLTQPKAAALLTILVEKMNTMNAVVASQEVLCKLTGMSRATLNRNIKILRDDQWIKTLRVGGATGFFVNAGVFWKADRISRVAAFTATVLTSEDEQEMSFEDWDAIKTRTFPVLMHKDERLLLAGSEEEIPPPDQREMDLN